MTRSACRDLDRSVDPFVDGELSPSEMVALQAHVEDCRCCSERVEFERAMRTMVRSSVTQMRAPEALRARCAAAMTQASQVNAREADVLSVPPRLLSWRVAGPMAAAAALALVVGAVAGRGERNHQQLASATSIGAASAMSLDSFLDELVDQHAHPLPPETTNLTEMAGFDRFVGVPVRPPSLNDHSTLLGARVVPVRQQRAAMMQYVMTNGHRVSVYVYNPRQIRMGASTKFRERVLEATAAPVYTGWVRGYTVSVTDKRGVGYAIASDLDEEKSSNMLVAVGP